MIFKSIKNKILSLISEETKKENVKLIERIGSLENELMELKTLVATKSLNAITEQKERPHITIEHITIEQMTIENQDLSSNFGQLGIKDLSGQLFIGTTYDSSSIKDKINESKSISEPIKSTTPTIYIKDKNNKTKL